MTTVIQAEIPVVRDWKMKRGSDFARTITLKESDRVTIRNTTGYTMTMTIKEGPEGKTYASLAIGSGITNTPSAGQFNILIPAATNQLYEFASATYEITITDSTGGTTIPFIGTINLT